MAEHRTASRPGHFSSTWTPLMNNLCSGIPPRVDQNFLWYALWSEPLSNSTFFLFYLPQCCSLINLCILNSASVSASLRHTWHNHRGPREVGRTGAIPARKKKIFQGYIFTSKEAGKGHCSSCSGEYRKEKRGGDRVRTSRNKILPCLFLGAKPCWGRYYRSNQKGLGRLRSIGTNGLLSHT